MRRLLLLLAPLAADAVTVDSTGFTVTEDAPFVFVTEVGVYRSGGDVQVRSTDATSPKRRRFEFGYPMESFVYRVCTGTTPSSVTNVVATIVKGTDGRWTDAMASSGAVRITSITLRGSVPEVTVEADPLAGSVVRIEGKASLADPEWGAPTASSRFFRAIQTN